MINQNNTTLINACQQVTISIDTHQAPSKTSLVQALLHLLLASKIKLTYPAQAATLVNKVIFTKKSQLVLAAR